MVKIVLRKARSSAMRCLHARALAQLPPQKPHLRSPLGRRILYVLAAAVLVTWGTVRRW